MIDPSTSPVWFSDAARSRETTDFCLVCWAYGSVITRHRPAPPEHEH